MGFPEMMLNAIAAAVGAIMYWSPASPGADLTNRPYVASSRLSAHSVLSVHRSWLPCFEVRCDSRDTRRALTWPTLRDIRVRFTRRQAVTFDQC